MDTLEYFQRPDLDTLLKAFEDKCVKLPNLRFLGTRNGDQYDWMSFKEVQRQVRNFAAGAMKLDLVPTVEAEGKTWRFMGMQSKNRKEWNIIHLANMHLSATSVPLYDTLSQDAIKFVTNQTELSTYCCSNDLILKMAQLKIED